DRRASLPETPCWPGAKVAVSSGRREIARMAAPVTRRNSSIRVSTLLIALSMLRLPPGRSDQCRLGVGLLELGAHGALVVLGHDRTLHLVALVQEGDPEGEGDVVEDARVLGPGDHR